MFIRLNTTVVAPLPGVGILDGGRCEGGGVILDGGTISPQMTVLFWHTGLGWVPLSAKAGTDIPDDKTIAIRPINTVACNLFIFLILSSM